MLGRRCLVVLSMILLAESTPQVDEPFPVEAAIRPPEVVERVANASGKIGGQSCEPPVPLESIIGRAAFLPILFASSASRLLADKQCGRDAQRFLAQLGRGSYWAARVFDSSTKIPDGVLAGNKVHYGHFDECYFGGVEDFGTKYCLVDYAYNRTDTHIPRYSDIKESDCAWDFLKVGPRVWCLDKSSVRLALCAPASCTPSDIELSLTKALEQSLPSTVPSSDLPFSVSVRPTLCQSIGEKQPFTLAGWLFCILLALLCTLMVIGSRLHPSKVDPSSKVTSPSDATNGNWPARDFLRCFSVQRNFENLVKKRGAGEGIDIIDPLRGVLIVLSAGVHRSVQYLMIPPINMEKYDNLQENFPLSTMAFINNTPLVDVFFTMTAILITKSWLEKLDSGKAARFLSGVTRRYIRMTPSVAFVILFYMAVLPHLGSGPYWRHQVLLEANICRETWWHNILYIHTYTEGRFCIFQSWHAAVDQHAYILMFFVTKFFWKLPRRAAYRFLVTLILLSSCARTYVSYVNRFPPGLLPTMDPSLQVPNFYDAIQDVEYFYRFYVKTHLRISPFFIGGIAGAMIVDFKKSGKSFSKLQCLTTILLGLITFASVHLSPVRYVTGTASDLEIALINGFFPIVYSTSFAMMIVVWEFTAEYKRLGTRLNTIWIRALSKLTFGIYVSHYICQLFSHGSVLTARDMGLFPIITSIISDTVMTLACSLLLWFAIESPIQLLITLISGRRAAARRKTD